MEVNGGYQAAVVNVARIAIARTRWKGGAKKYCLKNYGGP